MSHKLFVYPFILAATAFGQQSLTPEREAAMKADLAGQIDAMKKQAQVMVDSVFYDLALLSPMYLFEGGRLAEAIVATFRHRERQLKLNPSGLHKRIATNQHVLFSGVHSSAEADSETRPVT